MIRPTLATVCAFALAFVSAACSDGPTPPRDDDPRLTLDIAASAGEEIAGDVSLLTWGAAEAMTGGGFGPLTAPAPVVRISAAAAAGPPCPFAGGKFSCTRLRAAGYDFDRTYQLLDAAGSAQSGYDEATTASIKFTAALQGSTTLPNGTFSVTANREATLSGLAGTETQREWNGTGTSTVTSQATRDNVARTYTYTSTDAISHLVYGLPRLTHPYPLSGQITRDVQAQLTREGSQSVSRTSSRHVVATFDGTSTVKLQVGSRNCTLTLDTKAVSCQ